MPCSVFWVVSHWLWSECSHIQQWPHEMLNGMTTRSPTSRWGTVGADLLDDPHRLVTDDVAGLHERREHLVEVQVRAAQT